MDDFGVSLRLAQCLQLSLSECAVTPNRLHKL